MVDGDGQHDLGYVVPLLRLLTTCDVALGNRLHPASAQIGMIQPIERRQANDLLRAALFRLHPPLALGDFFSGFLGFRVKSIPTSLDLRGTGYASPARMWPCLAGAGVRIAELPTPRIYYTESNTFARHYRTMQDLANHIVKEFVSSTVRHLGVPGEVVLETLRVELQRGHYAAILSWFASAVSSVSA
jgi:hypothetical protein